MNHGATQLPAKRTLARMTTDGTSDRADERGLGGAGRCSLFGSAYRALRDWLAHPDVDCDSASVLLRHRNKRDFYSQLIAACDFGMPEAATPAADRSARPASARRHGRDPVRDDAAPHPCRKRSLTRMGKQQNSAT